MEVIQTWGSVKAHLHIWSPFPPSQKCRNYKHIKQPLTTCVWAENNPSVHGGDERTQVSYRLWQSELVYTWSRVQKVVQQVNLPTVIFFLNLWPQDLEFLFPIFHTRWSLPRPLQLTNDSFLNYFQEAALQKLAWALYFEINPEHCRNCLAQIRNVSFLACVTPTTQIRNPPMDKTVCADHIIL